MKNYLLIVLFLLPLTLFAQTNFSGKWALDKTKTNLGEAPLYVLPQSFEIDQKPGELIIRRNAMDTQQATYSYSEVLPFDGSESKIVIEHNGTTRQTSLKWGADKKTFLLNSTSFTKDGVPGNRIAEDWSLADNGKTLIVNRKTEQSNGVTFTIKAFYTKL